ncbi:flagellar export chaperone FliS [Leptospira sp. 85282-16]|uniref:Flagellar secretion chaperone FliS n=1 Tax=Leptospira montravelensis TaxID=2484961 RepID=A0ABY2LYW6_9LEPT|nr:MULTISPECIES: flagellar export chaperone FliS [Leptospira]MCT8332778.1 flagellar export chaperone FliS [Leptospira sp. 85282-16]TGK83969.1 flagellar export chaperone FliS [Leptospira montravelensis]TGL05977.1 flagellar export chaperone FliS [Leptospira montravelensis]
MSLARKTGASAYNEYKANEISTVSQIKLIVMLFDGAIRFLGVAKDNMTPRKYDVVNNNIIKTQDIITELLLSLNMEEGKEVANNLLSLYVYLKKRLLEANMRKDKEIIEECIKILIELKMSWEELEKKDAPNPNTTSGARPTGISITG